jgi:hypothetical protein
MAQAASPIPAGFHTITLQLQFDNAREAIDGSSLAELACGDTVEPASPG